MAIIVMVYGQSGTGKSTSLRNFKPEDVCIVNVSGIVVKMLMKRQRQSRQQTEHCIVQV